MTARCAIVNTVVVAKDTKMIDFEKPDEVIKKTINEQLNKIKVALRDRNLSKVAIQACLHENTVRAIASGKNLNPSYETIKKLSAYLFGKNEEE